MKFPSAIVVSVSLLVLSACSTVPTPIPKLSGPAVVVIRDTGFTGGGCTFEVRVNGEVVGQVGAGQTVIKKVANGKHRVAIHNTTALCSNVTMSKVVEVSDAPVVLRIGITSNFQTIFDQVE